MSPKRLRKIALYLEYIAFVMRQEADAAKKPPVKKKNCSNSKGK